MADVSAGALRFDITADNSQFMSSMRQAQDAHEKSAGTMAQKYEEAGKKTETAFSQAMDKAIDKTVAIIKSIQTIGEKFGEAFKGGAAGAEKATTDLFNSMMDKGTEGFEKLLAMLPGPWGKAVAGLVTVLKASGAWDAAKDFVSKKVAGWFESGLEASQKALGTVGGGYVDAYASALIGQSKLLGAAGFLSEEDLQKQEQAIKDWAAKIKNTFYDMYEGIRDALQKIQGTWQGIRAFVQDALDKMSARADDNAFQRSILGLSPKQIAEAKAARQFLVDSGKQLADLNKAERAAYDQALERAGIEAELLDKKQKDIEESKRYEQAIISVTAALKRQGETALANAGMNFGKSAYDRALERNMAMAGSYGRGKNGEALGDDDRVKKAAIAAAEDAQLAANIKFNYELAQAVKQQAEAYDLQTQSLGKSAAEAARMAFVQQELNKANREGVPINDELRASIEASADAIAKAKQRSAEATEKFEAFRQVGQTVANSLENAFAQWIGGTQVRWKEFIAGLQADLAKLAFKRGIEDLLLGTQAKGGGGLMGGLFNLLGLGGERAAGGPVGGGTPYIVGERGPELFVPQGAGTIVPNHAMGGGGNTTIAMSIDLKGANGDETIARISAMAARQAAVAAIEQANQGFPGRSRSYQLLEG